MTQFSIGTCVFEQIRGSPMCSPLSPALCLMVVALSEEVWHRTFESTLTTMNLTSRLLRYVDFALRYSPPGDFNQVMAPISASYCRNYIRFPHLLYGIYSDSWLSSNPYMLLMHGVQLYDVYLTAPSNNSFMMYITLIYFFIGPGHKYHLP